MELANLISVVKENSDFLAYNWFEQIRDSKHLKDFQALNDDDLINNGKIIFETFALWIEKGNYTDRILMLGKKYYSDDFSLDQIIESIFLAKSIAVKHLVSENPLTKNQSFVDTVTILNDFFDHLISYITTGYTSCIYNKLKEDEKYTDAELLKLFHLSSIDASNSLMFNDVLEKGLNSGIIK